MANNPKHLETKINGITYYAVEQEPSHYNVSNSNAMFETNFLAMKHAQMNALEIMTGCKVIDADYVPGTVDIMQAQVDCTKKP